jgi:hypothetical protein|tara:strand:- start:541 stop:753 length:213 start_codon:yes stop_codon:yes gene_type:complete
MVKKEIIEIEGNLYQVIRRFKEGRINLEKGSIQDLKTFLHCEVLFKAKGYLWACNKIIDVEYEEINETHR